MNDTPPVNIGARLRRIRLRRGMSQRALAGLAGIDQSYLSRLESGDRQIDRRSILASLAEALQVSVAELTNRTDDPTAPVKAKAAAAVPAIRDALIMRDAGYHEAPDGDVATAMALSGQCDYASLGPMLPGLLRGVTGADLVMMTYATKFLLRHLGYDDLAREAGRLGLRAAQETDDPAWVGVAQFTHITSLPPESATTAVRLAEAAADAAQPHIGGSREARQAYGMLHLTAALRAAIANRDAQAHAHLYEAEQEAASLGEPDGLGLCTLAFGPTNVKIWRMAVEAELGDLAAVVDVAQSVEPERLPLANRQGVYWADLGVALAGLGGRDADAVAALARAESVAPQYFRLTHRVHESVRGIHRRAHRNAVSKPLARLAEILTID